MIDLRNKCVLIRTQEECEKILEEAKDQGFRWFGLENMNPFPDQKYPDVLKFDNCYWAHRRACPEGELLEAATLLGTKEMTAREFVKNVQKILNCSERKCQDCVFNYKNTKCGKTLCSFANWIGCTDELISIAKSGRTTIKPKNETPSELLQRLLDDATHSLSKTSALIKNVQIVVDNLKEQIK